MVMEQRFIKAEGYLEELEHWGTAVAEWIPGKWDANTSVGQDEHDII
jgi:sulfur relay (sulfurtransferase) DsrC/TusE family protein